MNKKDFKTLEEQLNIFENKGLTIIKSKLFLYKWL